MKKTIKSGALLALATTAITGCKKYEENSGPAMKTVNKRIVGYWVLEETENIDLQEFINSNGEIIFEFEKDGDINFSQEGTVEYSYTSYYYSYGYGYVPTTITTTREVDRLETGAWELDKDKENMEIDFNYSSDEYEIIRLSNSKMVLENEEKERLEFAKTK